jgi:hypothetical protein
MSWIPLSLQGVDSQNHRKQDEFRRTKITLIEGPLGLGAESPEGFVPGGRFCLAFFVVRVKFPRPWPVPEQVGDGKVYSRYRSFFWVEDLE